MPLWWPPLVSRFTLEAQLLSQEGSEGHSVPLGASSPLHLPCWGLRPSLRGFKGPQTPLRGLSHKKQLRQPSGVIRCSQGRWGQLALADQGWGAEGPSALHPPGPCHSPHGPGLAQNETGATERRGAPRRSCGANP